MLQWVVMKDRLRARLPSATEEQIEVMDQIIQKYGLELTIRNLDQYSLLLFDDLGRSVRISFGEWRNKTIHILPPATDIAIIVTSGIVAGWIKSSQLEMLPDRSIVDTKLLAPMPETDFVFIDHCNHLEDNGGFKVEGGWECAACERRLL